MSFYTIYCACCVLNLIVIHNSFNKAGRKALEISREYVDVSNKAWNRIVIVILSVAVLTGPFLSARIIWDWRWRVSYFFRLVHFKVKAQMLAILLNKLSPKDVYYYTAKLILWAQKLVGK